MSAAHEPTDGDREVAAKVVGIWKHTGDDLAEIIAYQLADERAKARAPFLALADRFIAGGGRITGSAGLAIRDLAAAEQQP